MKDGTSLTSLNDPFISIDRASRSWAIFEEERQTLVHGFIKFTNEQDGLAAARAFVAERSTKTPRVVYPFISRMSMR